MNFFNEVIFGLKVYELFLYFFIYGFLGWCLEVSFHAIKSGGFVNRGFLNGPICPIYGVGAVAILLILQPVIHNIFLVFILSTLITTAIELVTGFFLEFVFKNKWWDYSDNKFNLFGYVCLYFSLLWGLACLFAVKVIQPLMSIIVNEFFHEYFRIFLIIILMIVLVVDMILTITQVLKFNASLKVFDVISLEIRRSSEFVGRNISEGVSRIYAEYLKLQRKTQKVYERILKSNPGLRNKKYKEIIEGIKERFRKL